MKIFLDTADVDMIRPAYQTGLINGVTTNPTLIKRSGRDPIEVIKEMSVDFPNLQSISAEVVADTAEEMVDQAQAFNGLWNVTIKVPCTVEGLKACTALAATNYKVNVTLVFSVAQAILAEKAGASFVSPFVGRWLDNSVVVTGRGGGKALRDWADTVSEVKEIKHAFNSRIMAREGVDY